MIHILDYKSATFDFDPHILLQYVDLPRIFQKFISETPYIKQKLDKDGGVIYKRIDDNDRFTVESLSRYIEDNKNISVLISNIDIFDECYITPNNYFNHVSKKHPNIKFIVTSDETFFRYSRAEYKHNNVFYILNGISNPYSFVDNIDNIPNLASYYIMNDYLQEDYCNFLDRLAGTTNRMVRDKKYNFYNGVHKPHRIKCYELIKKHDLLNEGYFSYADFASISTNEEYDEEFMNFLNINTKEEYKEYISNFQIPLLFDTELPDPNVFVAFSNPPQTSFQSYISITTETNFQEEGMPKDITLSEKSFKPFYGLNIPLIIGQPIGITYLKDLGFDLFEDLFDITPKYTKNEIFNQLDKNLKKIKSLTKKEIHNFYFDNYDRVHNNFQLLTQRLKEKDIENLQNFLNTPCKENI